VRHAVNVPIFDGYADPGVVAELAVAAEEAGWDGFFVADHLQTDFGIVLPIGDAWITLAAVAARTRRMRIGPMVTPLARRRPWKVARETVALDILSAGRLTFGAGLGYPPDADFERFGEDGDVRVRAEKLDEALDVIDGLWSGGEFEHEGTHYRVRPTTFLPRPVQRPRIPVWIAGIWPRPRPFRRAARWDGVAPMGEGLHYTEMMTPAQVGEVAAFVARHRESPEPFDLMHWGVTPQGGAGTVMDDYAAAGATWWMETLDPWSNGWSGTGPWPLDRMNERVLRGPRG
jgi:alkanesulfonate monooxygenase SsuD/methylene tetrahydromethanopterin reductase-like flavin-dependent oxidoreductase (luciferase family)